MRSNALGIATNSKQSAPSPKKSTEKENQRSNSMARITEVTKKTPRKSSSGEVVLKGKALTPSNAIRTVSSKTSNEDADVNVEINITTTQNVQVRKIMMRKGIPLQPKIFTGGGRSGRVRNRRRRKIHQKRGDDQFSLELR